MCILSCEESENALLQTAHIFFFRLGGEGELELTLAFGPDQSQETHKRTLEQRRERPAGRYNDQHRSRLLK